jgi:hypothetical protein
MYLPNSFVELIKEPTHLRVGPGDVVHKDKLYYQVFVFRSDVYVSSFLIFPFFNGSF